MTRLLLPAVIFCLYAGTAAAQSSLRSVSPEGIPFIWHKQTTAAKAKDGDYLYFHGYVKDGDKVMRSSRDEGAEPVLQLQAPDQTGLEMSPVESVLRLMAPGDSATVLIPLDAERKQAMGFMSDTMNFVVVFMRIETKEEHELAIKKILEREAEVAANIQAIAKQFTSGKLGDKLKTTASGLKYVIHEQGTGPQATAGNIVNVHYYGTLENGTMFDNSFSRGEPLAFSLGAGQVIPGWDEGIALLKIGGKATLFIPAALAYGEEGSPPDIPAGALLIFYVELLSAR